MIRLGGLVLLLLAVAHPAHADGPITDRNYAIDAFRGAAIADYRYNNDGDYRIWPGPNSNTFVATVLRAVPELATTLPPNAVGKDFRSLPYAGPTDSGTGLEASLWGLLGIKTGWIEGLELNFLGLVAGLDIRHPAVKLPGFGRIGLPDGSALAAPAK